jgi:hypothetical protein
MPITNDRRNRDRQKDSQCDSQDVNSRLGSTERQGISIRNDSDTVLYSDSERRNQARAWANLGGQATPGGIYRRLKELHQTCLSLIESQQKQLETSLQNSKQLTAEIDDLEALLAETLQDIPEKE